MEIIRMEIPVTEKIKKQIYNIATDTDKYQKKVQQSNGIEKDGMCFQTAWSEKA